MTTPMDLFNASMKKKILLRAPVLTQSGYGVHARQIAKWLLSRNDIELSIQALPWGDTPWLIDRDIDGGLVGKIMEKTTDPAGQKYDVSVQLQLPNEWDPTLATKNIGITAGVETDVCNPAWIQYCNNMSVVVVPSTHSEKCLKNSGRMITDVEVIPESFSDAILSEEKTSIDSLTFSTNFNFLFVGQITGNNPENDRKNFFYTIKWFCETFSDDKDVGLIVKTNAGRNTKLDQKAVHQMLMGLLSEVRKNGFPKIHFIHGDMSDGEMASLYRHPQIKALINLTRGEGYGLPILEAAASGLPVLATAWSGHMDFLSHGKFLEIAYKLDKIHSSRIDENIFMKNAKWAYADEEDFKKKAMKFRKSPGIPTEWARDLKDKVREKYNLANVIQEYDNKLGKYIS